MSYLRAFIQHSLQPAKKNEREAIPSAAGASEQLSTAPVADNDLLIVETGTVTPAQMTPAESSVISSSSSEVIPPQHAETAEIEPPEVESISLPFGNPAGLSSQLADVAGQPNQHKQAQQSVQSQPETKVEPEQLSVATTDSVSIRPPVSAPLKPILKSQARQTRAVQAANKNIISSVNEQSATPDPADTDTVSPEHRPDDTIKLKQFIEQQDPERARKGVINSAGKAQNNQVTAVASYNQQRPAESFPLHKPVQHDRPQQAQSIPQVRIGHINVLIDDQATPKPSKQSTVNTAAGNSNPFGIRGL